MSIKFGDICKFQSGGTPSKGKSEFFNGTIPWITTTALNGGNIGSENATAWITEQAIKESAAKIVPAFSLMVGTRVGVGKVAINTVDMSTSQDVISLLNIDESIWSKEFLCKFLEAKSTFLNSQARGATIKGIKIDILSNLELPEIPLEKQIYISQVLDEVKTIIILYKQQLSKLDELVKARFVEMFGDPKLNKKGWKMNTFGSICTVRQGLQIPISKRLTEYEDDCYEYITVQYLHGGKDREYIKSPKSTVICNKDDILMTRTGNTGMVVTGINGVFHNNFFLIDFDRDKYDKDFLVQYLNLDIIQADILRRAGTSTIPDLNHGEFYKIPVFEPPIKLQNQFKDFLHQVNKSKVEVQKALDKTQMLFDSLMQQYFG